MKKEEVQEIKLPTIEEIKKEVEKVAQEEKKLPPVFQQIQEKTEEKASVEKEIVKYTVEDRKEEKKLKIEELRKVVPLFIKLERYEEVLNTLEELKNILKIFKSFISTLDESEKIRNGCIDLMKQNLNKFEEKLSSLDSILLRPATHEVSEEVADKQEVKDTLLNLKSQIDKLKHELESLR
ncbi:MAG: hypothetical protein QW321_02790 [Candidatus Aenigmatarchaeota archaeon]